MSSVRSKETEMAASSSKPTAVHYALVVFVMFTVGLGIFAYISHRDMSDKLGELATKTDELNKQKALVKSYDDQVQALKKIVGKSAAAQVEDPTDPNNANTVIALVKRDMNEQGLEVAQPDTAQTMQKLRESLNTALADRNSKAEQVKKLETELQNQKDQLNARIDTANKAQAAAEAGRQEIVKTQDGRLLAKQQEIDRLKQDYNGVRSELYQEKEAREKERNKLSEKVANLENRIVFMQQKIDDIEKLSFEVADGLIQRVDNVSKLVWINLGDADHLKPRLTFSVYGKENHGVGRGAEDVKGKVEVTRILGPHMAEARILDDDIYRPMVKNDLLYTPLWSPGLVEKISIVGKVDLDNDGRSDRAELKQIMAVSGAEFDNEVDDDGVRHPEGGKITVRTKFLVLGDVPELDKVVGDTEKDKVEKTRKHLTEMINEARANGVRVIKLNDFLAFIGFESKRRMFLPGDDRPYTLKSGSTSSAVNEPLGDRVSGGQVSGAYTPGRKSPPQTSNGATSKVFGGNNK
jgi:hypothetical protein